MRVLVVDIGGTNVKILATGQKDTAQVPVRPQADAEEDGRRRQGAGRGLEVRRGRDRLPGTGPRRSDHGGTAQPRPRLGGFDFKSAFGRPVRIINDAAMQALGSYKRGLLLFLGLGTGLGAALVADGVVIPMELAHLSFKNGTSGLPRRGLERLGRKKWQKYVEFGTARMIQAVHPDDVVLGGGNVKKLKKLPRAAGGQQRQRVHRRLPPVGERVEPATASPGVPVVRRDDRRIWQGASP